MIWLCIEHNNYNDKTSATYALTNDTPYLALTGEIWRAFRELYKEKWPRYSESALYKDRMIVRPSYLYNSHIGRTASLYWTVPRSRENHLLKLFRQHSVYWWLSREPIHLQTQWWPSPGPVYERDQHFVCLELRLWIVLKKKKSVFPFYVIPLHRNVLVVEILSWKARSSISPLEQSKMGTAVYAWLAFRVLIFTNIDILSSRYHGYWWPNDYALRSLEFVWSVIKNFAMGFALLSHSWNPKM